MACPVCIRPQSCGPSCGLRWPWNPDLFHSTTSEDLRGPSFTNLTLDHRLSFHYKSHFWLIFDNYLKMPQRFTACRIDIKEALKTAWSMQHGPSFLPMSHRLSQNINLNLADVLTWNGNLFSLSNTVKLYSTLLQANKYK